MTQEEKYYCSRGAYWVMYSSEGPYAKIYVNDLLKDEHSAKECRTYTWQCVKTEIEPGSRKK